jgi:hypothetical protein
MENTILRSDYIFHLRMLSPKEYEFLPVLFSSRRTDLMNILTMSILIEVSQKVLHQSTAPPVVNMHA